jgi:hypothetical protein
LVGQETTHCANLRCYKCRFWAHVTRISLFRG